jgi:hypothetical protein
LRALNVESEITSSRTNFKRTYLARSVQSGSDQSHFRGNQYSPKRTHNNDSDVRDAGDEARDCTNQKVARAVAIEYRVQRDFRAVRNVPEQRNERIEQRIGAAICLPKEIESILIYRSP